MTWSLLFRFASAFALAQGEPTGNQTWIADLKARQASLGRGDVRIEGVVVDIRSTASEARRGLYRLIDESEHASYADQFRREIEMQAEIRLSADAVEGRNAFLEKRAAKFTGR